MTNHVTAKANLRFRAEPSTVEQADAIAELILELLDMARATEAMNRGRRP